MLNDKEGPVVDALGWCRYIWDRERPWDVQTKATLAVLVRHVNSETGEAHPSLTTIAAEASSSRTKVLEALRLFEELGVVKRQRRRKPGDRGLNLYVLPLDPPTGTPGVPVAERTSTLGDLLLVRGADATRSPGDHKLQKELSKGTTQGAGTPRRRRALWHFVPDGWAPKESHRTQAESLGVDFDRELRTFRGHEFKDGRSDADRAFSNWLERSKQFAQRQAVRTSVPQQGTAARVTTATLDDAAGW